MGRTLVARFGVLPRAIRIMLLFSSDILCYFISFLSFFTKEFEAQNLIIGKRTVVTA